MPQLTLADALRYFFAPFVICFCYFVYDPATAETYASKFGPLGPISFLVAGSTIYYVYRSLLYEPVILLLYDRIRRKTHRTVLIERYKIRKGFLGSNSTRVSARLLHKMTDDCRFSKSLGTRNRPMRAAGIHMLYQAGTCTLVFSLVCVAPLILPFLSIPPMLNKALLFAVVSLVLFRAAVKMDMDFEDEMVLLVESLPDVADNAARELGLLNKP